ncbi:hypothetical protein SKAU_G00191810 [Synaphobranchus kaupii]|uniref:Uncharacterized protein n=1 Tax=Synaphobranchus kaupii TaxID=118154 RepID=A0A9Q1FDV2_SYNKA|nr:hypothetical protein SKAU_G00191810 [Synaphobranchus kaupii]
MLIKVKTRKSEVVLNVPVNAVSLAVAAFFVMTRFGRMGRGKKAPLPIGMGSPFSSRPHIMGLCEESGPLVPSRRAQPRSTAGKACY